jgi:type I restriction enzyme S subunit
MKTFRTGGDPSAAAGGDGVSTGETVAKRFRYLATVQKGRLPINGNSDAVDADLVPYLTMEYLRNEIADPPLISNDPRAVVANDGDLLLLWDGSNAGEFLRAKSGIVSSTAALVTSRGVDREYLYWACKALEDRVRSETVGMGIPHVNGEYLANLRVPTPHEQRQRAIADYLDRETARIDALIAAKERVLALLAEKRRALITRAVTKGLDPTVPMKDSGIPWLGKIPAHWKATRLKFHLHRIEQGWSPQCEAVPAGPDDWGVLKAGCVNGDAFNPDENKRLPDHETPLPNLEIRPGDVLMSRANTTDLLGSAAIAHDVRPRLLLCDKLYRLDVNTAALLKGFLVYFLRTPSGRFDFERTATGASNSMQNISQEVVRNVWLPVPPLDEQRAIVEHITEETAKLDALRAATERSIALLKERRAALISAAVTGQIDVGSAA